MKKTAPIFAGLVLAILAPSATPQTLPRREEYDAASLTYAGTLPVLVLKGDLRRMGRQCGVLMRDDLRAMNEALSQRLFRDKKMRREDALREAAEFLDLFPQRYKDFLHGLAETSRLDFEDAVMLNAAELLILDSLSAPPPACSALAAWGPYTPDGALVFGRNYDLVGARAACEPFLRFLVVTVFQPEGSGNAVANIGYLGSLTTQTAMNGAGLFLDLNNGGISGGEIAFRDRIPILVSLFSFLLDASTFNQLDACFASTRPNFSYIINAADRERACSYEWPTFGLKRRSSDREGLLAATNHFVDESWGLIPPEDGPQTAFTVKRRQNLLNLAEREKGKLTPEAMMRILDTPLEKGGATFPEGTLLQVVAVPGDLVWWVKLCDRDGWQKIDLRPLLAEPGKK